MNPTEGQIADLSAGEAVRLSPNHFVGQCPMYLTCSQIKKIQTAAKAGKGVTIKFSKAQIAYCHKNGSGLLTDIVKGGIKFATPYAADFAKKGVGKLVGMASDKAQSMLGDGAQHGEGWGDIGRWVGHTAVDGIAKIFGGAAEPAKLRNVFGKGARPARKNPPAPRKVQDQSIADMAPMDGSGWIHDAGRWVGHRAVDGLATALGGSAQGEIMAALRQKKVKVGGKVGKGLYQ